MKQTPDKQSGTRRGRPLMVAGTRWRWRCGDGGNVVAYSEHGVRRCAVAGEIKWKITSSGMVKPSDVRKWLLTPEEKTPAMTKNKDQGL